MVDFAKTRLHKDSKIYQNRISICFSDVMPEMTLSRNREKKQKEYVSNKIFFIPIFYTWKTNGVISRTVTGPQVISDLLSEFSCDSSLHK